MNININIAIIIKIVIIIIYLIRWFCNNHILVIYRVFNTTSTIVPYLIFDAFTDVQMWIWVKVFIAVNVSNRKCLNVQPITVNLFNKRAFSKFTKQKNLNAQHLCCVENPEALTFHDYWNFNLEFIEIFLFKRTGTCFKWVLISYVVITRQYIYNVIL